MTQPQEQPSYIGHRKRLRAKFLRSGLEILADHEIIELMLTFALPRRDTKPLAWALLKRFGSVAGILDATPDELCQVKGIGPQAALLLNVTRALFKRYTFAEMKGQIFTGTPESVLAYCKATLSGRRDESLEILLLSSNNTIFASRQIAQGQLDKIVIEPRQILSYALIDKAKNIVIVHNHPSGDPTPSDEDKKFTYQLIQAAAPLGIGLQDHIIIGKGDFYSFRTHGLLD